MLNIREDKSFTKSTENYDSVFKSGKADVGKNQQINSVTQGLPKTFYSSSCLKKNQQEKAIVFKVREETGSMKSTNK